jgi:hypothetical protein
MSYQLWWLHVNKQNVKLVWLQLTSDDSKFNGINDFLLLNTHILLKQMNLSIKTFSAIIESYVHM